MDYTCYTCYTCYWSYGRKCLKTIECDDYNIFHQYANTRYICSHSVILHCCGPLPLFHKSPSRINTCITNRTDGSCESPLYCKALSVHLEFVKMTHSRDRACLKLNLERRMPTTSLSLDHGPGTSCLCWIMVLIGCWWWNTALRMSFDLQSHHGAVMTT